MAKKKTDLASRVEELIRPTVEDCGVELIDVKYLKENGQWILRVIIDKRGGILLEDCERVSRAIEPVIDDNIEIRQSYNLEVQSPGIDRPLSTQADFKRYQGENVELSFYKKIDGQKKVQGALLDSNEDNLTLEVADEVKEYPLRYISKVQRVVEF